MGTTPQSSCRPLWTILVLLIALLLLILKFEWSFTSSWEVFTTVSKKAKDIEFVAEGAAPLTQADLADVDPSHSQTADVAETAVVLAAPGHDPYEVAKAKFRSDLLSAGSLAVLTPRNPDSPLELRPSPSCAAGKPTLRVFLSLSRVMKARFSMAMWSRPAMAKYGFAPANNEAEADIFIFALERRMPQVTELVHKGKKVVVFAKTDDVTRGSDAQELEHPNFLGIFKEFVYRNLGDYLEPRWNGRALSFHICDSPTFKQKPCCDLTPHGNKTIYLAEKFRPGWKKVRSVNWNWEQYYGIMKYMTPKMKESHSQLLKSPRDIDVFMAVHLRDEPGSYARAQVVVALEKYTGPKELHLCKSREGAAAFPNLPSVCLTAKQYSGYLRRTKIVVCPWGFGERTSCEHGGWVSAAVVVKPWTDFVVAFPDMYRNGSTYMAALPDYSDLFAKVEHIVGHWDSYFSMRESAQKLFFKDVNQETFIDHFWASMCDLNRKASK